MYQCDSSICKQKFSSLKDLVFHEIYSCFYRLKMNCEQCECNTDSRSQMEKHIDEYHATTRFCDLCPETFSFIAELRTHNIDMHDVLYNPDIWQSLMLILEERKLTIVASLEYQIIVSD